MITYYKKKKILYTPVPSTHYSLWDVQLCVSYIFFYNSVYGNFVHMGVQQVRLVSSIPTIKNERKKKDTRTAETMNFKSMCFFFFVFSFVFFRYDAYDLKEDFLKKKKKWFCLVALYSLFEQTHTTPQLFLFRP